MRFFPSDFIEMFACNWRNRELIKISVKRDILLRYRGSTLGILWAFITPLLMLAVFTFVFSVIFQARWNTTSESKAEFALLLFAGLIVYNFFSECITRAPTLIINNSSYVKKVIYPLETLPVTSIISGLFSTTISVAIWIIAYAILVAPPKITIILLPLILIPFCLLTLGLSFLLASLGVFLRDISQFIGVAMTILLFLSPVFYPVESFPENYRYILYLNPLTTTIEETRNILYLGKAPESLSLVKNWALSFIISWIGFFCFQKTRKGFADVL